MSPGTGAKPGQRSAVVRLVPPPGAEPTDADLVWAARAGSADAAAQLFDRHAALVRRILRRSLGPSSDVEDALQDSFLRLFRDLDSLRDANALRSFLIGITLHVATSELRKRKARRWLLLSDPATLPEPQAPALDEHDLLRRDAIRRLYGVLDRLDAQRRVAFVMRHIEGLELTELAVVLGCSLATTKRRLAEANQRVRVHAQKDPVLAHYLQEAP